MKSLIELVNIPQRIRSLPSLGSLTYNAPILLKICDFSKLTNLDLLSGIDSDDKIIMILQDLLTHPTHPLSLDDFKTINFEKFNRTVRYELLNHLLSHNYEASFISVLLGKMETVNYGNYCYNNKIYVANPLMYCCYLNRFDLVELLIEKHNADINYLSCDDKTAIMFSASAGYENITEYLYKKGAILETSTKHIDGFATESIKKLITKWNKEKQRVIELSNQSKLKNTVDHNQSMMNELKKDYENMKREYDLMKQNLEYLLKVINENNTRELDQNFYQTLSNRESGSDQTSPKRGCWTPGSQSDQRLREF